MAAEANHADLLDVATGTEWHFFMLYDFQEWEEELEPQPSSARIGGPLRKLIGIGVQDPPGPRRDRQGLLPPYQRPFRSDCWPG